MERLTDYAVEKESLEEQYAAGRYNPAGTLNWAENGVNYRVTLSAGASEHAAFFQKGDTVIALSYNYHLGYAGVQVFRAGKEIAEFFTGDALEAFSELDKEGNVVSDPLDELSEEELTELLLEFVDY